jgi:hypothetical protein
MHASNKPESPAAPGLDAKLGDYASAVRGLWSGALGTTVRCVPTRRTVAHAFGAQWLFAKWRTGKRRQAAAEWRWLHVLPLIGLRVPEPIAWLGRGRRTLLVTAGVPGRALDAWAVDAAAAGWLAELVAWACTEVAPLVRRLHERGFAYRDLYWNHVFCVDPRRGEPPAFLDVERVFRPRFRKYRWLVKDLAGLRASVPVVVPERAMLRFARAYLQQPLSLHRRFLRALVSKAARIRARRPRFG